MDSRRVNRLLGRALRLKCPDCGLGPLYKSLFKMNTRCDYCGLVYEREQGYFVGAIYLNVIATESLLLGTLVVYGLITGRIDETILTVLVILALTLPLVYFHHTRSFWLCIDHLLNPRDKAISNVRSEEDWRK